MFNTADILETISMIREENLDIRTITMGISLLDCATDDPKRLCDKIYDKITRTAERIVPVGEAIEKEYGIPIINKRVSVTPISLVGGELKPEDKARVAASLDASVRTMAAAFELADFGCWTGIIESVVYEGLYAVGGAVLQGTYQKSKRYTERQRKGRTQ